MSHPEAWTIRYVFSEGGDSSSFMIQSNETVGSLRDKIKEKNVNACHNVDSKDLSLYYTNLPDSKDLASRVRKEMAKLPKKLVPSTRLVDVFKVVPPEATVHIIVRLPGAPPSTIASIPTQTPRKRPSPHPQMVENRIEDFLQELKPKIVEFFNKPLPYWSPSVVEDTRLASEPELLEDRNSHIEALFSGDKNKIVFNESGAERTRLLLQGLSRNWGFYLVAKKDVNHIGSRDLEATLDWIKDADGWTKDIFAYPTSRDVLSWNIYNEGIVRNRLIRLCVARWRIFRAFIEVAKECYGPDLCPDIKYRWLIFQILPVVEVNGKDPFTELLRTCFSGVNQEVLDGLNNVRLEKVLGNRYNPSSDRFFLVLDEAQVAGNMYLGSFCDATGIIPAPVLRAIIQVLTEDSTLLIVSGTNFSLDNFEVTLVRGCAIVSVSPNGASSMDSGPTVLLACCRPPFFIVRIQLQPQWQHFNAMMPRF